MIKSDGEAHGGWNGSVEQRQSKQRKRKLRRTAAKRPNDTEERRKRGISVVVTIGSLRRDDVFRVVTI